MLKYRLLTLVLVLVLFSGTAGYSQDGNAVVGEWLTEGGESLVKIYPCHDRYCGKIVWLNDPKEQDGREKTDTNNPDPSKKGQKIIGLVIVWDFIYKGENKWGDGKIYDPKNGKTYSCKMRLEGNKLNVRGFVGVSLLGRTTIWTKGLCLCP